MDAPEREDDPTSPRKTHKLTFQEWMFNWHFEEERLKTYIEEYKEEEADVEYCPYCVTPRDGKKSCCGEQHWITFSDFDDETQMTIIMEEYDNAFRPRK